MFSPNPYDYGIVIGINDYPDSRYNLKSPCSDAKAVYQWLVSEKGGGLDPLNCRALFENENNTGVRASLVEIENSLLAARDFAKKLKAAGQSARRLYFYFSGHGVSIQADEVLMCHALWSMKDRPNANLSSDQLDRNFINPCTAFNEVVVWLDCCRNRQVTTKPGGLSLGCGSGRANASSQRAMIAFATLDGSYAWEALNENDENSIFTEVLLAGLKYARNDNKKITWRSLQNYLEEYVPLIASERSKSQTPQIKFPRLLGKEDPAFCVGGVPVITLTFNRDNGSVDILDKDFEVVASHELSKGALSRPLPVGRYLAVCNPYGRSEFSVTGVDAERHVEF